MGNKLQKLIKKETLSGLDRVFPIDEAWVNRSLLPALPEVLPKSGWSWRRALLIGGAVAVLLAIPASVLGIVFSQRTDDYAFYWSEDKSRTSSSESFSSPGEESISEPS
ncbi:MAG: hypothetical protein IJU64_01770 [Bacilli bacterium]|nr:hypothetical protein [Bacilli bacterium]